MEDEEDEEEEESKRPESTLDNLFEDEDEEMNECEGENDES